MFKWLAVTAATAIALPLGLLFVAAAVPAIGSAAGIYAGGPSALALADIPASYLAWYMNAAQTCPGLPWAVLAGIGKAESDHGRSHDLGCIRARTLRAPRGRCNFCRPRRRTRSTATTTVGWISMTRRMRSSRRRRCCAPPPANTPNSGSPPPAHSSAGSPPTAATPPRSPNPTSTPGTPPTASTSGRDESVAAAFGLSYRNLPADQQRLFRRLGLHPGTDPRRLRRGRPGQRQPGHRPQAPLRPPKGMPVTSKPFHRHRHRLAAPGHTRTGRHRPMPPPGRPARRGRAALREALAIYQRIGSPNAQRVETTLRDHGL